MTTFLPALTAGELLRGYRERRFTPSDAVEASLRRAREVQPALNLFSLIADEAVLREAADSTRRWAEGRPAGTLDGIPVAVKDTAAVRGWPTGFGSLSSRGTQPASADAPLVQRLREQGALFVGKTTAPEFAWKGVTDSALTGVTRNPWNQDLTPGGSSGGSAAAVAVGAVPIATGADGAGSLRIPASFSGVLGLKPTAFLVPNLPTPLGQLAVVGALTRTVEDQALFLQAVVSPDSRDGFAAPFVPPFYAKMLDGRIEGMRIGLSPSLGFAGPDPEIARVLCDCATVLRDLGAVVTEVDLRADTTQEAFEVLWALAFSEILHRLPPQAREEVEPALLALDERAAGISGREAQGAGRTVRHFSARMGAFFEEHDLLMTPTVPVLPFEAGRIAPASGPYRNWWDWSPLTWPFNLSGNPAISCPAGFSADARPIGVQFVAQRFDETSLLRVGRALERRLGLCSALADRPGHPAIRNPTTRGKGRL